MAGGLGTILGYPQVTNWFDPRRAQLLALASGLSSSPDFGQAVSNGLAGAAQGKQADDAYAASKQADAERQANINMTQQWIAKNYPQYSSLPVDQAYDLAKADLLQSRKPAPQPTTDIQNFEYGQTHPGFLDQLTQKGGAAETSLTPLWVQDTDPKSPTFGKPVPAQLNKAGKLVRTELPAGVVPVDPATLQGDKTTATVDAKTAAAARAALPGAQQAFDLATKAADALLNDSAGMQDQFGNLLGVPNQMMPMARPGSDMARFRTELAQAQGNAFLQARQVLKGAGQVTDYEGAKAESAYSRMVLAAQQNNQQEFVSAVQDFKQAVAEGYAKLQAAANNEYAKGGPGVTGNGNQTSTGVQWSYTP